MANPQTEHGHVRIANEVVEALARVNLSAYEWRILMAVLRKTYGWNKKIDFLYVCQLAQMTGLRKQHASRAKLSLLNKRLLLKNGNKIGFNKDYEQWAIKSNVTSTGDVTDSGYQSLIKSEKRQSVTSTGDVTDSGCGVTSTGDKSSPIQVTLIKTKDIIRKTSVRATSGGDNLHPQPQGQSRKIKSAANSANNGVLFDKFWATYPRKMAKVKARQAWDRLRPSAEVAEKIIRGVRRYEETTQWQTESGRFIPHPTTFLNQRRWEDKIEIDQLESFRRFGTHPATREEIEELKSKGIL